MKANWCYLTAVMVALPGPAVNFGEAQTPSPPSRSRSKVRLAVFSLISNIPLGHGRGGINKTERSIDGKLYVSASASASRKGLFLLPKMGALRS